MNVALALERPLLVKGEPGTGKTLLGRGHRGSPRYAARALAREEHDARPRQRVGSTCTTPTAADCTTPGFNDGDVKSIKRWHQARTARASVCCRKSAWCSWCIHEIDKADPSSQRTCCTSSIACASSSGDREEIVAEQRPVMDHHLEREEPPDVFPASLRVPLHRFPRKDPDARHRRGASPRSSRYRLRSIRPSTRSSRSARCADCAVSVAPVS